MNLLVITIFLFMPLFVISLGVISLVSNIRSHESTGSKGEEAVEISDNLNLKPLSD